MPDAAASAISGRRRDRDVWDHDPAMFLSLKGLCRECEKDDAHKDAHKNIRLVMASPLAFAVVSDELRTRAAADGSIVDAIIKLFEWILANKDAIIEFIKQIIDLFIDLF